ncbi:MAG: RIP metalloprotease RseP [Chitinophagales bacterium]|nr:RIP metalloprotease RseP [Chitinophagales bacterium]
MDVLIQIAQLVLSLSILVVLHELGHFIPAKLFKTRVEKFYLFFDPWFSLVKKKIGETEYGIGWLPLGGYVKIAGMIDESMDKEQMKQEPQPWEFRSKPAWQRLIIMLGGVTVNIILAFLIYAMLLFANGEQYLAVEDAKYGIVADSLAQQMGLRNGDKIIGYDHDKKFETFTSVVGTILLENALSLRVDRNGEVLDIPIPRSLTKALVEKKGEGFISMAFPAEVGAVQPGSPIQKAGAKEGDAIIAINGSPVRFFDELRIGLRQLKGQTVPLTLLRGADTVATQVTVSEAGTIGFAAKSLDNYFKLSTKNYTLFQAIPAGIKKTGTTLSNYLKQFRLIFDSDVKGYKQVGSFITITQLFPKSWDWTAFWNLTAFLSIMLAVLNVLPIPALDGGHALFTIIEIITGKKPSEKFLEYAQMVGMILLLTLMVFALGNDIFRNFLK